MRTCRTADMPGSRAPAVIFALKMLHCWPCAYALCVNQDPLVLLGPYQPDPSADEMASCSNAPSASRMTRNASTVTPCCRPRACRTTRSRLRPNDSQIREPVTHGVLTDLEALGQCLREVRVGAAALVRQPSYLV